MPGRIARRSLRWMTRVLTAMLVLLALTMVIGRSLVDEVDRFHAGVEQWLSERSGADIRFQSLRGEWGRASPEFFLEKVTIALPGRDQIWQLDRLALRINLLRSLQHLSPRVRIRASGVRIALQCDGTTCFLPPGTRASASKESGSSLVASLLSARPRITLSDSRITLEGLYPRPAEIRVSSLNLWWESALGWASGEVTAVGPDQLDLQLKARIDVTDSRHFNALLHVTATQAQLTAWLPPAVASRMALQAEGGRGRTQAWLHFAPSGLTSATLDVSLRDVLLRAGTRMVLPLQEIGGQLRWIKDGLGQWTLAARQIRLMGKDFSWRPSSLFLESTMAGDASRYRLRVADVRMQGSFRSLLEGLDSTHPLRHGWLTLQPVGRIQDLDVRLERRQQAWQWLGGRVSLRELSWQPWETIPGMRKLAATVWLEASAAWVLLDTRDAVLDYPSMMRGPITLDRLQGAIGLDWDAEYIRLRSGVIQAATADLNAATRLRLNIPRQPEEDPGELSLQVTLRDGDAAEVSRYLPAGLISPALLEWLDGAIKGGVLQQGDILVHGPLRSTERPLDRSVMLGFKVREAQLQFLPEWQQPVSELVGDVIVDNGQVQAEVTSGRYFGLALRDGQVRTYRDPATESLRLEVQVKGTGDAGEALPILRETPLGSTLGEPLKGMTVDGAVDVSLLIDAPLKAGAGSVRGAVDVQLPAGRLGWPAYRLQLDDLQLDMTYGLDGSFVTRRGQATFLGRPIQAKVMAKTLAGQRFTRLSVTGDSSIKSLEEWSGYALSPVAAGQSGWQLEVDMHPRSSPRSSQMVLTSSLAGVSLDLPPPFGKPSAAKIPLQLTWSLSRRDATHVLRYGRQLAATWRMAEGRVSRLGLRLGAGEVSLPPAGSVISGRLPVIDVEAWQAVMERWRSGGDLSSGWDRLIDFADSSVHLEGLRTRSLEMGSMQLALRRDNDSVILSVDGEKVKGRMVASRQWLERPGSRNPSQPVILHVERLVLPARALPVEQPMEGTGIPRLMAAVIPDLPAQTIDPAILPLAQVRIDDLRLGDEAFGRYSLDLTPMPAGVRLDHVDFELKTIRFSGSGEWRQESGRSSTTLSGRGAIVNVADVMSGFGYAPSMTSQKGSVFADVGWSGAPWQFAVHRTNGRINASLHQGRFLTVDNNAARRVWGFLNFKTWMRRMQFEFDDIAANEMTYNKVGGRFLLGQNRLSVETLQIDTPSIDMRMQGELDLGERHLDMVWFVTIPVTRNLMLPAVVVGGLPAAATAFVVDRVLGKQIDRLTTLTYDVKGPFDAPVMEVRTPL